MYVTILACMVLRTGCKPMSSSNAKQNSVRSGCWEMELPYVMDLLRGHVCAHGSSTQNTCLRTCAPTKKSIATGNRLSVNTQRQCSNQSASLKTATPDWWSAFQSARAHQLVFLSKARPHTCKKRPRARSQRTTRVRNHRFYHVDFQPTTQSIATTISSPTMSQDD